MLIDCVYLNITLPFIYLFCKCPSPNIISIKASFVESGKDNEFLSFIVNLFIPSANLKWCPREMGNIIKLSK
jgi:hypothetical protein